MSDIPEDIKELIQASNLDEGRLAIVHRALKALSDLPFRSDVTKEELTKMQKMCVLLAKHTDLKRTNISRATFQIGSGYSQEKDKNLANKYAGYNSVRDTNYYLSFVSGRKHKKMITYLSASIHSLKHTPYAKK